MMTLHDDLTRARKAHADVLAEIRDLEANDAALATRLGDALARSRMGERKAQGEAGAISMERGKLAGNLTTLRGEARSIEQRIAALEDAEQQAHTVALTDRWSEIVTEARELEATLGAQVIAAANTAQQLQRLGREYEQVHRALIAAGVSATMPGRRPAPPAGVMLPGVISAPEAAVANWRHKYTGIGTPQNAVRNPVHDALRAERDTLKAAKQREREEPVRYFYQGDEMFGGVA